MTDAEMQQIRSLNKVARYFSMPYEAQKKWFFASKATKGRAHAVESDGLNTNGKVQERQDNDGLG